MSGTAVPAAGPALTLVTGQAGAGRQASAPGEAVGAGEAIAAAAGQ